MNLQLALQILQIVLYGLVVTGFLWRSHILFARAQEKAKDNVAATGAIRPDLPAESTVLLEIYRQKYLNFRHFDTLRWGVHTVVIAAAGLVAAYAEKATGPDASTYITLLMALFGVFSLLGWWLLYRLAYTHMKNSIALKIIADKIGDWSVPPIAEKGQSTRSSAAFLFMAFVGVLGGLALAFALWRLLLALLRFCGLL